MLAGFPGQNIAVSQAVVREKFFHKLLLIVILKNRLLHEVGFFIENYEETVLYCRHEFI
jgi:hypothetical protein